MRSATNPATGGATKLPAPQTRPSRPFTVPVPRPRRAEPTAAAAGTTLVDDLEPAVVEGDPALLAALVTNLVDNALRHGRPGGRVEVALRGRLLSVANDGDVLEPDEAARLTEAFHRGARRVHGAGGHGLGLAIVQAVADRHGARLELVPRHAGGLRVDVEF